MIPRVRHYSHSSGGFSRILRSFSPARKVQISECVAGNFANLIIKGVSPTSNGEPIAGGQRHLSGTLQSASRNSYLGPCLKLRRQGRRYVPSLEVAANGDPDYSTMSKGADTRSQGFGLEPSGESRDGFNSELFQKQAQELRQAIVSGEFEVKPTPYTPVDGTEVVQFYVTCALLFLAFWVGNYLAPNLIFRDTVFSKESGEDDALKDESPRESEQIAENLRQQGPASVQSVDSVASSRNGVDGETEKVVLGFGKAREQTPRKPKRS